MDYDRSDSSGTDDDLPPFQSGRASRGPQVSGSGRSVSGSGHYGRSASSNQHVQKLEKEAYVAVLRAFTAQSEVITWRKEQLMVTLRQELRISDEQHLQFLMGMNPSNGPNQFRDRPPSEDEPAGPIYGSNMDSMQAPTSRKKQKTSHASQASLPPPLALPSPTRTPIDPAKRTSASIGGQKNKKIKGGHQQLTASVPSSKPGAVNPWIGKRVKIRWPDDNAFYEAVITDYDPAKDVHGLTYEMNTENETWEWVDLRELSSSDLQVIDGPPVPIPPRGPPSASANFSMGTRGVPGKGGNKKGDGRTGLISGAGRGRSTTKGVANSFERSAPTVPARNWKSSTPENELNLKGLKNIKLPSLEALVKQVDKIAEEDDLTKIEAIKRTAKEHEEMLKKALAEVGESSEDAESDDEENPPFSHTRSIDRGRERSRQDSRNRHGDDEEDDTARDREGSDGEPQAGDGGVASDGDDDHGDYG